MFILSPDCSINSNPGKNFAYNVDPGTYSVLKTAYPCDYTWDWGGECFLVTLKAVPDNLLMWFFRDERRERSFSYTKVLGAS